MPNDKDRGTGAVVTLRDRYLVFPSSPLPELATPSAQAFMAEDRRDRERSNLFALICKPTYVHRIGAMRMLKGVENPGLMTLIEWGVADWPPLNRKVMILIYVRPAGRLWDATGCQVKRMDEGDVIRKIIQPAIAAMKGLKSQGVTHRAIRPTNMFWATEQKDRVVFGDCTAAPPAFEQPNSVEPVESALCMPAGRGDGTLANDIYSFGASLAMILQGRDITAGVADEKVIRHKMVMGSYSALAAEARLPLALVEILRGMLCDDPIERWDSEALDLWLSGRRLTPLVPRIEKRAIRTFTLSGREFITARELAIGVHQVWDGGLNQLGDGKLALWLSRALDNKDKATAITNVLNSDINAVDRRVATDITLAKICMTLDPSAPVRYKSLSMMLDGVSWLLPMAIMGNGGEVRIIAEALMRELPKAWFETREAYNPDNSVLEAGFRTQKGYLDRATIGNGIERVLYELNDSVPCLSPMLIDEYVVEMRELLPALNAYAKKKGDNAGGSAIDRHIVAFIAARASFDVERMVSDLATADSARATMTMINLLAMIQWRLGQTGLVALTQWLSVLAKPALKSYHNRARREALEAELPKVARDGNIVELARLIDSADERGADHRGFEEAKQQWVAAFQQARDINDGHEEVHESATRMGQQVASLISITGALITVAFMLLGMIL